MIQLKKKTILNLTLLLTLFLTTIFSTYSANETQTDNQAKNIEKYNGYAQTTYIISIVIGVLAIGITIIMITSNYKIKEYRTLIIWLTIAIIAMAIYLKYFYY